MLDKFYCVAPYSRLSTRHKLRHADIATVCHGTDKQMPSNDDRKLGCLTVTCTLKIVTTIHFREGVRLRPEKQFAHLKILRQAMP